MTSQLTDITLHTTPSGAAISVGGSTDIRPSLESEVRVTYRLGGVHKAVLAVGAGTVWGKACLAGDELTRRQAVRFRFDGGGVEWWRIESIDASPSGGGISIELWPWWTMLDSTRVRQYRGTTMDLSLALVNVTPREALIAILAAGGPSGFYAGAVHPTLGSDRISVELNGETHLDGLYKVLAALSDANGGYPAEFVDRWVGSACYLDIVPWVGASGDELLDYVPRASTRLIAGPTGAGAAGSANRIIQKWQVGGDDYLNRVIPVCGDAENRVTIGRAMWRVASYASGTITLEDAPLASPLTTSGPWYFGNDDDGFFQITSRLSASRFVVSGDASAVTEGRFAVDADGSERVTLETDEGAVTPVEVVVEFPVVPYRNLLASIDTISEDMSTWSSGLPLGMRTSDGDITVAQSIDPVYVRYGRFGARVTATEAGEYVEVGPIPFAPTDENPYFSVTLNAGLESGRIRLEIIDAGGVTWPTGSEKAESTSKALMALQVGGLMPAMGNAWVRVTGMTAGTVFTIDSLAVTQSTEAQPYAPEMGPEALWMVGLEHLRKAGGSRRSFDTRFIDASRLSGSYEPVEIGSYVLIRDAWDGSAYRIEESGRVQEMVVQYSASDEPFTKRIRVANRRPEVTGRLYSGTVRAEVPAAPRQTSGEAWESTFTSFVGGDAFGVLSQDVQEGPMGVIMVTTTFEIPYGTLVEIRPGDDQASVAVWALNTVEAGRIDAPLYISSVEPVYEEGLEGDEGAVTNASQPVFEDYIEAGAGLYAPVASLVNTLRQTAAAFDAIAKRVEDSDAVTRIGSLASDHITSGLSTVSTLTIAAPGVRVALRPGWQIVVRPVGRTTGEPEFFTVSSAVDPGAISIPVVAAAINAREGDLVMLDPFVQMAFLRVEPTQIRQEVVSGRKGRAIVTLDAHATGTHSVLEFEGSSTLGTKAAVGDKFVVVDDRGNRSTVYCNGTYDETASSMAISPSITFTRDIPAGSVLEFPDGETRSYLALHDDEINLRVESGDVIAAINLIVDEEIDAARIEIAAPNIFLVGELPSGESISSNGYDGTGGWELVGAGDVTLYIGSGVVLDSVDGVQFYGSQSISWRDTIPNGNVLGEVFSTSAFEAITMASGDYYLTLFAWLGAAYLENLNGSLTLFDDGDMVLDVTDLSITSDKLGFFGATAASKPAVTGSRGGNAALADLLTDLATLGLITDSTTA